MTGRFIGPGTLAIVTKRASTGGRGGQMIKGLIQIGPQGIAVTCLAVKSCRRVQSRLGMTTRISTSRRIRVSILNDSGPGSIHMTGLTGITGSRMQRRLIQCAMTTGTGTKNLGHAIVAKWR